LIIGGLLITVVVVVVRAGVGCPGSLPSNGLLFEVVGLPEVPPLPVRPLLLAALLLEMDLVVNGGSGGDDGCSKTFNPLSKTIKKSKLEIKSLRNRSNKTF
jgi:hypothetical protein